MQGEGGTGRKDWPASGGLAWWLRGGGCKPERVEGRGGASKDVAPACWAAAERRGGARGGEGGASGEVTLARLAATEKRGGARGGGVLGEERGWGPWGSGEPWRRGESSEEGVVVHWYLSMYKSLWGGGGEP